MESEIKAEETSTAPLTSDKSLRSGFEWVSTMILALVAVACVFAFLFRIISVSGDSMMDTLQNGDRLIMSSLFYTPEPGDIVVISRPDAEPLIKRVIAVAGDRIRIDGESGIVYLNGIPQDEPYTRDGFTPTYEFTEELTVPQGCIFAMGDNRSESLDSRSLGAFSLQQVMGEVIWRLAPTMGSIKNGE